jgi:hypothetical protein
MTLSDIATESTPGGQNGRIIIPANTIAYDGTKIRITVVPSAHTGTLSGSSVCNATTSNNQNCDATPTRITWDTGSSTKSLTGGGGAAVSDEVTYAFDHTKRYLVHYWCASGYAAETRGPTSYMDWSSAADKTVSTTMNADQTADQTRYITKVEILNSTNVWSTSVTTQPTNVWFDGVKGRLVANTGALTQARDWFWASGGGGTLSVYAASDPSGIYTTIEAAARNEVVIITKDHVRLEHLILGEPNGSTASDVFMYAANLTDVQIGYCELKNTVYGVFDWTATAQLGGNLYEWNHFHDIEKHGIYVSGENSGDGSTALNRTVVRHNLFNDIGFNGIFLYSSYWLVENNEFYNCAIAGDFLAIHIFGGTCGGGAGTAGHYNIVRRNYTHDNGLRSGTANDSGGIEIDCYCAHNEVYNNFSINNYGVGIAHIGGTYNSFYNNTVYGNFRNTSATSRGEIRLSGGTGDYVSDHITVKNNIAFATDSTTYAIRQTGGTNYTVTNNDFWGTGQANWYDWDSTTGATLSWLNSQTGVSANQNADPLFVSASDFHLQAGSPAINAGTNVGLSQDYYGKAIVAQPEIGAVEKQPIRVPGGRLMAGVMGTAGGGGAYILQQDLGSNAYSPVLYVGNDASTIYKAFSFNTTGSTSGAYPLTKLEVDVQDEGTSGPNYTAYIHNFTIGGPTTLVSGCTSTNTIGNIADAFANPYAGAWTFSGCNLAATTSYYAVFKASATTGYLRFHYGADTVGPDGAYYGSADATPTWSMGGTGNVLFMRTYSGGP